MAVGIPAFFLVWRAVCVLKLVNQHSISIIKVNINNFN